LILLKKQVIIGIINKGTSLLVGRFRSEGNIHLSKVAT